MRTPPASSAPIAPRAEFPRTPATPYLASTIPRCCSSHGLPNAPVLSICAAAAPGSARPPSSTSRPPYRCREPTVPRAVHATVVSSAGRAPGMVSYQFGNRCAVPAVVDLARAGRRRTIEGQEVALAPYDPKGEVRPLELDGRWTGKEVLAYPTDVALAQVCVDAASIAHRVGSQWVCFGRDAARSRDRGNRRSRARHRTAARHSAGTNRGDTRTRPGTRRRSSSSAREPSKSSAAVKPRDSRAAASSCRCAATTRVAPRQHPAEAGA
jgi:hypothetical protein